MKFYFAPLEGLTTYVYRNIHHRMFKGIDKYYTPFVSPSSNHNFKSREKKDVIPEHNRDIPVVPQILTNHADEFLYTAERLVEYGYREINLNLGCPSGTVASKGRGSGFLAKPEDLDRFLDEIYEKSKVPISIKTRIGRDTPDEFYELLKIYNQYPVYELTIHPRVRQDFYKNKPNWEIFEMAISESRNPVCYNGDINTTEDYERFRERFPSVDRVMIGRGLIANPAFIEQITFEKPTDKKQILSFERELRNSYLDIMSSEPVLFKMKEIWAYMYILFPEHEKLWKSIKKTHRLSEYEDIMRMLAH